MQSSRYPRPGHRLAPNTLRELLLVPLPKEFRSLPGASGMTLADLDERVWERFSQSDCRKLAEAVVRQVARAVRTSNPIGGRRVPALPRGLTLADLNLEVRTLRCLAAAGIHQRPQDLHLFTIDGLLSLRGFWAKSLVDLLTALEYVIDHPEARQRRRAEALRSLKHLRTGHRYPRPGQRLAPVTLKEVLLDRAPAKLLRATPLAGARLCDLDESVWKHLPPATIARLAKLIVARSANCVHHRQLLKRRVPPLPVAVKLDDLHLETRTYNCLAREGLADRLARLSKYTIGDLLRIRSFGVKSLVDLLTALESVVARKGKLDRRLTTEAKRLAATPGAVEISFADPRLGGLLRAMDPEANTVGQLVNRLLRRRIDPVDPDRLCHQMRQLRQQIAALGRLPLEEELKQVFGAEASQRDQSIVAQYYGWDGRGRRTLEQLGRKFGLSRERIRQVCLKAARRIRQTPAATPVLDRTLDWLRTCKLPLPVSELQARLDATGLTAGRISLEAVLEAAKLLGRKPPLSIVQVGSTAWAVRPETAALPGMVVTAVRRVAGNYGAATLAQLCAVVEEKAGKRVDRSLVCAVLDTLPGFAWLDSRRRWFKVECLPRYGLAYMINKVLAVAERIDVGALRDALARRSTDRRPPPQHVLLEFCRHMPQVRVAGSQVWGDPPQDWRKFLSGTERVRAHVLHKHGPVLSRGELERMCGALGVKQASLNVMLAISPVVVHLGRSRYRLVGCGAAMSRQAKTRRPVPR